MTINTQFFTPDEVSQKLKVGKQTVMSYIAKKELEAIKLGYKTIRIPASALYRFLESKKQ